LSYVAKNVVGRRRTWRPRVSSGRSTWLKLRP